MPNLLEYDNRVHLPILTKLDLCRQHIRSIYIYIAQAIELKWPRLGGCSESVHLAVAFLT